MQLNVRVGAQSSRSRCKCQKNLGTGRSKELRARVMTNGLCVLLWVALFAGTVTQAAETNVPTETPATGLVYHPDYLLHDTGASHPERPERLKAVMAHLKRSGLLAEMFLIEPRIAEEHWIMRVHTRRYLNTLAQAAHQAPTQLDPDTHVSRESVRVAKLATGGVLAAIDAVMAGKVRNAFVAARPPGHHALHNRAMGFCLINHVAVAARYVQEKYGVERVLIVDWDVYHGNGTQELFYDDPSVLYFSTHQSPFYPGTGWASETGAGEGANTTINVPLPAGATDDQVIRAFEDRLSPAAEAFKPGFVLISAGFDGHRDDPLAHLTYTEEGFRTLTELVMAIAQRYAKGRIVSVLEGGYNLEALARSVEVHLKALAEDVR